MLTHIEAELQDIKRRLERLDESAAPIPEVHGLRQRVVSIEHHLGIDQSIAA